MRRGCQAMGRFLLGFGGGALGIAANGGPSVELWSLTPGIQDPLPGFGLSGPGCESRLCHGLAWHPSRSPTLSEP